MASPAVAGDPPEWPMAGQQPFTTTTSNGMLQLVPNHEAPTTQDVQAVSEGAVVLDDSNSAEFLGKRFRLADNIGLMPLMQFANSAKKGLDSSDMDGLAAMYALVRDTVDQTRVQTVDPATGEPQFDEAGDPVYDGPSEWMRFEDHAITEKAEGEELMAFIQSAMSVISARPRKPRGTSSDSSRPTSVKSKVSSSSRVTPEVEGLVPVADLGR